MIPPSTPEVAAQRVRDGTSWNEFCELLKAAGHIMLEQGVPDDDLTRAEGLRYLTRLTRAALQTFVENGDPRAPVLQQVVHQTAKMGSDNPDNHYSNAAISGEFTYRITGNRGTVHWLEFATQAGQYGEGRGMPPTGHLDAKDLILDDNGNFIVQLSVEPPTEPGVSWLPMKPASGTLIVRQSLLDPSSETLATLHLTRVGGDSLPTLLTPQQVDQGLRKAGMLVGGAARIFADWAEGFQKHTNQLPRFDQALSDSMGGVPDIAYYHSYWALGPDQCLVVEVQPPPCDHWNFQINNHWMESLDYRYFKIHVNSKTAVYQPDGSIQLVVSHTDPGHPNWIQTVGHHQGTMCFRWVRPEGDPPTPACRVVPLSEIRSVK